MSRGAGKGNFSPRSREGREGFSLPATAPIGTVALKNRFSSATSRWVLLFALAAAACGDTTIFDPMERQPKYKAFSANPFYEDGRGMRQPPAGAVPRERQTMRPELNTGLDQSGAELPAFPMQLTRELLDKGRERFEIHCAVCHGLLGDGISPVATQMSLRPPPSLLKLTNAKPGRLFRVMTEGFGLMPPYNAQLTAGERWAVAAYVTALRRSQTATVSEAPPEVQKTLAQEKP